MLEGAQLTFRNQFFVFEGVSEEEQFKRAYKLFTDGYSVCVHRHKQGLPCVPMTTPNGSDGCVRVVDGGYDSTGEPLEPTLVDVSESD